MNWGSIHLSVLSIELSYHDIVFSLSFKIRSGNAAMRHIKPNLLQSRQFSECFHKSIFIFQIRLINHIIPVSISIIKKHWFTVTYTSMALNQSTQRKGGGRRLFLQHYTSSRNCWTWTQNVMPVPSLGPVLLTHIILKQEQPKVACGEGSFQWTNRK